MTCAEVHPLLHALADDELDPVRSLEVEKHAQGCPGCAAQLKSIQSLRVALQNNDLAYRAPTGLRQQVRAVAGERPRESSPAIAPWLWKGLAATAAAFAILVLVFRPAGMSSNEQFINEAVASHVRSLMAAHLTDVASSDQHTVKPWFDGKLDFAPDVKDYAAQGFPLAGGRLDYLNNRAVAALVYRHNKHFINVFVWPSNPSNKVKDEDKMQRGYSVILREMNGFDYCLVSDLNETELAEFSRRLGQ